MRIKEILGLTLCLTLVCTCKKNEEHNNGKQYPNKFDKKSVNEDEQVLYTMLNPLESGIRFINALTETPDMNGFFYEYYYNGAGVSVTDVNNDGLQDILFISSLRKNQLYLNNGNLKFKDITQESGLVYSSGYRTGVTNVDINNDGLMDFYISKSGKYDDPTKRKNELWVNHGPNQHGIPTFKEQAELYNLDIDMCSTQAAFFDYDLDGDLDMFLINHYTSPFDYKDVNKLIKKEGVVTGDRLYQNNNGKFYDVTKKAGITNINRLSYGLGVSIGDLNNDGWPDIYVANDYEGKDFLYLNNKNGKFTDVANQSIKHVSFYSMGTDIGDINNDGWMDFISLDMMAADNYTIKTSMSAMEPDKFGDVVKKGLHYQYMYNALQINNGTIGENSTPVFSDVAQLAGVASTDWSWGPLIFDMDNDGQQDIFVSNGIKKDFRNNDFIIKQRNRKEKINNQNRDTYINNILDEMPTRKKQNYFFKNNGDLTFSDMSTSWVSSLPTSSNGAAYADLDNDGDLDIVVNNADDVSLIYKNNAREQDRGNFLKLHFKGNNKNTKGVGARVTVKTKESNQTKENYTTRGFQSAIGNVLHFGIGDIDSIDTLIVNWPDGKHQQLINIKANQDIVLNYSEAKNNTPNKLNTSLQFKTLSKEESPIYWKHQQNEYNDFKREILLPHKMSQQGPAIAIGDINGDGLDDIYLGGALGQTSHLYLQNPDGSFKIEQDLVFNNQKNREDTDAVFFDADNDGDLDLYVVSGGNEKDMSSSYYQDNFYLNNNGVLVQSNKSIPAINSSGSCVRAFDFDNDGDLDLFLGGRQTPGKYPLPTNSYLLKNESDGKTIAFKDVSKELFQDLESIGMVTDALPIDLNEDGKQDLLIVGEWMPVKAFLNTDQGFKDITNRAGLNLSNGWWNTIKAADFDNDGDLDLIVGNLGSNYKYKAIPEKPFKIYASDFDKTGTLDIVLSYYEGNNLFPLRGRSCSSQQMPFIKKKFETYDAFGKASLIDVYGAENLNKAVSYEANTFESAYFENTGKGHFKFHPLPKHAQISSINDILIDDFDKDDNLDVIIGGNLYNAEVETPRNDASYGLFMKGDGHGGFLPVPMYKSGLNISGEIRKITKININGKSKPMLLFALNDDALKFVTKN
ncbi:VCBS repeat-containing protein [Snuella sedimenti]|uniref:VCBS repeat-containing protein n=1 Tax=Snuella sedimenti TaxID=2798802 RepID=A0A8J7J4Q8_9FLAO|nr:VCBS repeat-containing protein [Snuella sedimenti]MBJ6368624.1 VCBS repeat-containing protein [Snuella sedimenti]